MMKTLKDLKVGDYLYNFEEESLKQHEITGIKRTHGMVFIYILNSEYVRIIDEGLVDLNSTGFENYFTTGEEAIEDFKKSCKIKIKKLKKKRKKLKDSIEILKDKLNKL